MNLNVTVYDVKSGAITSLLSCLSQDLEANIPEGCDCIEGHFAYDQYTIHDGQPVAIPSKSFEEIEAEEIAAAWEHLRQVRNAKLLRSDWVTSLAYERKEDVPPEWKAYRDALRDLPKNTADPRNVIWPARPL